MTTPSRDAAVVRPAPTFHEQGRTVRLSLWRIWLVATSQRLQSAWLAGIILIGAALRLLGLDWDQGQHLHPDERFLTLIETGLRWPTPGNFFATYFNEAASSLNPVNHGNSFFVYGDLPVLLVSAVATALHRTGYDQVYLVGRAVEALVDVGTIALVYLLARRLYRDGRVALLAALFYALSALAIQQAHFFVVDGVSVFFGTAALYFFAAVLQEGRLRNYALTGACVGLALASKFSLYPLGELLLVAGAVRVIIELKNPRRKPLAVAASVGLGLGSAAVVAFVAFRLFQPYAFRGPGILGLQLAPRWLANGHMIQGIVTGTVDIPYTDQWADRFPVIFPLENLVIWGMGIPLGLTALAAWAVAAWQLLRHRAVGHLVPVLWPAIVFALVGTEWVMYLRYFLPVYPVLAVLAAWLLFWLWDRREQRRLVTVLIATVVGGTVLYAAAFTSIYTRPHTRVVASNWITQNVPQGAVVANESGWDDSLPLGGEAASHYTSLNLDLTAEETPAKLQHVLSVLDQADYLFISSNRQYGSLTRLPVRFPMVTKYYDTLFSGTLGFSRVADFTSYPQLLGIQLPDQGAEESWTVYDHPEVQIFRKTSAYSHAVADRLLGTVNWQEVIHLLPRQESETHHLQLLSPQELRADRAGGTFSRLFNPGSIANRFPVVVWVAALLLAGLIAFPLLWLVCAPLPDRGYAFIRPVGVLLVAWLVWWLASAKVMTFSRAAVAAVVVLLAVVAAGLGWWRQGELLAWIRQHARLLLVEEALFWGAFAALLIIRWLNPDLWHPTLGGEKPMDFAYLNAVIKSTSFPPYDPWLAGGYLNYYYFGDVLVAVLAKLTAIVPAVAYNLAVPTFFAFVAASAFGVVLALITRLGSRPPARRMLAFAALGTVFVAIAGNLGELRVLAAFAVGLVNSHAGPVHLESWFWDASRVIHHPAAEPGPITEFPAFTFLFADLHAHLLALPYTIAVLGFGVAFVRGTVRREQAWIVWGRITLLALVLGSLWAINAWDVPTYTAIAVGAVAVASLLPRLSWRGLQTAALRSAALLVLSYAFFLPFHLRYASAFEGFELWHGSQTSLGDYLTVHGLFLFCIAAGMLVDFWLGRDLNPVVRLLRLAIRRWRRLPRLAKLHRRLVAGSPAYVVGFGTLAIGLLLVIGFLAVRKPVPALIVGSMLFGAMLVVRRRPAASGEPALLWQATLVLIVAGLALSLFVEFFVAAKIDIGRMNTVFKLYVEVWVLLGLGAAAAVWRVFQHLPRLRPSLRAAWTSGLAVLLGAALLYPVLATPARINDRFDTSVGATLDGMRFMDRAVYVANGKPITLAGDAAAIRWMQANLPGSPVIAEVNTAPILYGWGNRYAVFTGNPAVVGWDWHQRQQRPLLSPLITQRVTDIQLAYRTSNASLAHQILERYGVQYVVVGPLENTHFPEGRDKWAAAVGTYWTPSYSSADVVVYRILEPTEPGQISTSISP